MYKDVFFMIDATSGFYAVMTVATVTSSDLVYITEVFKYTSFSELLSSFVLFLLNHWGSGLKIR